MFCLCLFSSFIFAQVRDKNPTMTSVELSVLMKKCPTRCNACGTTFTLPFKSNDVALILVTVEID